MTSSSLSLKSAFNVVKEVRQIIQPNEGFMRQLEHFEETNVVHETLRLRRKFGTSACYEDRKIINRKLEKFEADVEKGTRCQGSCSSRSTCPTHTCQSPGGARSLSIFRSRRLSSSSVFSSKRRKSLSNPPKLRDKAEQIRDRRNDIKSWPPVRNKTLEDGTESTNVKPKGVTFWKKLTSSWGGLRGRKQNMDEHVSRRSNQQSPQIDPKKRGAMVTYSINQKEVSVCSDCLDMSMTGDISSPLHRGINISSSSICSVESDKQTANEEAQHRKSPLRSFFSKSKSPSKKISREE